jgi:ketosteroid isomerase-like protein
MTNQDRWTRDQLEIRSLIENYSDAACRRDTDGIVALWADDGRWSVPDMKGLENVIGKSAIRETWEGAKPLFPFCFLICTPGYIEIEGDAASARVYTTEVLKDPQGNVREAVGRYDDEFKRINGKWLFSSRTWYMLHHR